MGSTAIPATYRRVVGAGVAVELRRGQYADVLVDTAHGRVLRFPRYESGRAALPSLIKRLRAARRLGLPAPAPLDADPDAPVGAAHLTMELLPGVGLRDEAITALGALQRERLVGDLVKLLAALRSAELAAWPTADRARWPGYWTDRWLALRERVHADVIPSLDPAAGARAAREVEDAVRAAHEAGAEHLTHGDLGGANVLVDPGDGSLTGVLDWDDSGPGDPAIDLASLAASLPPPVFDRLCRHDVVARRALPRARAYAATFALQDAVFGLANDDAAAREAGLATYR